jgi:hypothetical protein
MPSTSAKRHDNVAGHSVKTRCRRGPLLSTAIAILLLLPATPAVAGNSTRSKYSARKAKYLKKNDASGLTRLAHWCRKKSLFEEEKEALTLALQIDETHKTANKRSNELKRIERLRGRYETPWTREGNFIKVTTNTSEARLHFYCEVFASFYNRFNKVFGVRSNPVKKWGTKLGLKVFATRADMQRYVTEKGGIFGESTVGLYDPNRKEIVLFHDDADLPETINTLFHEGTHMFVHLALGDKLRNLPYWFNEGLAEYFGASVIDREGNIEFGAVSVKRLAEVRWNSDNNKTKELQTLLCTTASADFGSGDYAQSWAFVHMLVEQGDKRSRARYRKNFAKLYKKLADGADSTHTVASLFGPIDRLGEELTAYIAKLP